MDKATFETPAGTRRRVVPASVLVALLSLTVGCQRTSVDAPVLRAGLSLSSDDVSVLEAVVLDVSKAGPVSLSHPPIPGLRADTRIVYVNPSTCLPPFATDEFVPITPGTVWKSRDDNAVPVVVTASERASLQFRNRASLTLPTLRGSQPKPSPTTGWRMLPGDRLLTLSLPAFAPNKRFAVLHVTEASCDLSGCASSPHFYALDQSEIGWKVRGRLWTWSGCQ
jgi:hypothetical protein